MKKTKLKFYKPFYLGACILDISKILMYDFHYGSMRKTYGDNARLLSGIPVGVKKKIIRMFKEKFGGKSMIDFVGLRPKLYAYEMDDGAATKRAKESRRPPSSETSPSTTTRDASTRSRKSTNP